MSDDKPIGPFTLTRSRIILLILGALAVVLIIGAISGGVGNYQALRESASSSAEPSASLAP